MLRDIRRNLSWGLGWTLSFAAVYSALVILISLFRWSDRFSEDGATTWTIVAGYFAGAALAGVAIGLLRPLTDRAWGTVIVGIIAGIGVFGSVGYSGTFDYEFIVMALSLGVAFGGPIGYYLFRNHGFR